MSYMALYRKFRPSTFEDVKGQDHIVTTLKNQIKAERIGHAYLFCGTRGTGKTTIAKIFAKSVNCESPVDGNPCGECKTCKAIAAGASMNVIEIDAASNNGVDNIREIVDEVSYSPAEGKYKVYIIDEVHMLSIGAFNALLKTLEEPPSYVIFILATTEAHKLPITILSRCQRYDFKRITIDTIAARLRELMDKEGNEVEDKALRYVAKAADGSMRDALSLLDQCIAFHYGTKLTYDMALDVLGAVDTEVFSRLLRSVIKRDVLACINVLDEIVLQGRELTQFVSDFTWYLRNLLIAKTSESPESAIEMSSENLSRLIEEAAQMEVDAIMRYIRVFAELSGQLRYATGKRILIEVALIKLCRPNMEKGDDTILERLKDIEDKLANGVVAAAPAYNQAGGNEIKPQIPKERPKLDRAVPEDVKKVVSGWARVVGNAAQPMKNYLQSARLSLGGDNRLMMVLEDGIPSDYFNKHPENKEQLEYLISEVAGKEISVQIQTIERKQDFENTYVDLQQVVQMDVDVDDSDSSDF
ncbi:MAG: DNA polymerase III subunit gamma/tau [Lachnospiraceae bacterium]|nr:DNA polymerase III subunit gamma/tau [Lachnospiraceae bacterium]